MNTNTSGWRTVWAPWWQERSKHDQPCGRSGPVQQPPKRMPAVKLKKRRPAARAVESFKSQTQMPKYSACGFSGEWQVQGKQQWTEAPEVAEVEGQELSRPRGLRAPSNPVPAARTRLPWNQALTDPTSVKNRVEVCNEHQRRDAYNLARSPSRQLQARLWHKHGGAAGTKQLQPMTIRSAGIPPPPSAGALGPGHHNGEGFSHQLRASTPGGVLGHKRIILTPGLAERVYITQPNRDPEISVLHKRHGAHAVKKQAERNGSIPENAEPPTDMQNSDAFQCMGLFPDVKFLIENIAQ